MAVVGGILLVSGIHLHIVPSHMGKMGGIYGCCRSAHPLIEYTASGALLIIAIIYVQEKLHVIGGFVTEAPRKIKGRAHTKFQSVLAVQYGVGTTIPRPTGCALIGSKAMPQSRKLLACMQSLGAFLTENFGFPRLGTGRLFQNDFQSLFMGTYGGFRRGSFGFLRSIRLGRRRYRFRGGIGLGRGYFG